MKTIQVYGPGCKKCTELAVRTQQAMDELNIKVALEKVTDMLKFASAGVLITPALVIDGSIILSGEVPNIDTLKTLLQNASTSEKKSTPCLCDKKNDPPSSDHQQQNSSHECSSTCDCVVEKKNDNKFKKIVIWTVIILILLAVVKTINHRTKSPHEDIEKKANAEQTDRHIKPNRIAIIYYQYGARCKSCLNMETWTKEAIEKNFPSELAKGTLVFQSTPADKDTVTAYSLTTKSIILKEVEDNKEKTWLNLDQIWNLNKNEQAFKNYIIASVKNAVAKLP